MTHISRAFVRSRPDALFVFGDNMQRRGYKGQARAMRGETNAVGIPTKWSPARDARAYFSDEDWYAAKPAIDNAFARIEAALAAGHDVVIPADGIGTGLAELDRRAPRIFAYISNKLNNSSTA